MAETATTPGQREGQNGHAPAADRRGASSPADRGRDTDEKDRKPDPAAEEKKPAGEDEKKAEAAEDGDGENQSRRPSKKVIVIGSIIVAVLLIGG